MAAHFMVSRQQPLHITPNEGLEALRQQLFCTYMELDYIRKASKMQAKLTDAKLQQLQATLDATMKERDGAFQECKKLRQSLLHLSNDPMQQIQQMYPVMHAASTMTSSTNKHLDTVSEVHDKQSACTQPLQSNTLDSEPFQLNNLATNTLDQDELRIFDDDNSWQLEDSFHNSNEQFSMAISCAFDELDTLELPELKEERNLVSKWEAELTKASLSSPSSADSTAASQVLSKGNAAHHLLVPTTTGSSLDNPAKFKVTSLPSDSSSMGTHSPMATMTPLSTSSRLSSLSAHTPIAMMSIQACASPWIQATSESQSASVNVQNRLSISANVSPSTLLTSVSASQSALPIANMSNHLPTSAKPPDSSLAVSPTPSPYSPARMPNWFSMQAEPNSSPTSTLAPMPPAMAIPTPRSLSATHQCSPMIQKALMSFSPTSAQNTIHIAALRNNQSNASFSTSSPHLSTISPKHTSFKINQLPTSTLPQKRRRHLPEPPEANMDSMLSSLPKKGKLLEAVMQAGPLLQQLILAGPMPQWQHPPPQLNTAHIPRVPTSPNSVLSPFSHAQCATSCLNARQYPFTSTL